MGTLSVRENLAFSANLRLSNSRFTQEQRNEKVTQVINQLGLQDCADTKVSWKAKSRPQHRIQPYMIRSL